MHRYLPQSLKNRKGQTMVEYALLLLLVAVALAAVIPGTTTAIGSAYTRTAAAFP